MTSTCPERPNSKPVANELAATGPGPAKPQRAPMAATTFLSEPRTLILTPAKGQPKGMPKTQEFAPPMEISKEPLYKVSSVPSAMAIFGIHGQNTSLNSKLISYPRIDRSKAGRRLTWFCSCVEINWVSACSRMEASCCWSFSRKWWKFSRGLPLSVQLLKPAT